MCLKLTICLQPQVNNVSLRFYCEERKKKRICYASKRKRNKKIKTRKTVKREEYCYTLGAYRLLHRNGQKERKKERKKEMENIEEKE